MADLERRIRILTLCTVLSVTSVVLLAAYVMSGQAHGRFSQIDAERLNIIGTNDRPVLVRARGDYGVQRLFVGSRDGTAQVQLRDTRGRERIRLFVNEADEARLEFLDQMGEVVAVYPPAPPADEE